MNEIVRRAYMDAAEEILNENGEEAHPERLCAMTGLLKKDLVKLGNHPPPADPVNDARYNRFSRMLTGWARDKDFHTKAGLPAELKPHGTGSFPELVKRYGGATKPSAMKQELLHIGLISITQDNLVKLENSTYLSSGYEDAIQILGTDTADLIDSIRHNTTSENELRRFQRKVSYVDIPHRFVEPFRKFSTTESQKLLKKLDHWLARRNVKTSKAEPSSSRLGVGIYHIEEPNPDVRKDQRSDD